MPTIDCNEDQCPLVGADPLPKFCAVCGVASATVFVPDPVVNECKACRHPFGDSTPKFCSECGARTAPAEIVPSPAPPPSRNAEGQKTYNSVADLIEAHDAARAARGLPGGRKGRGLTAAELANMQKKMRDAAPADRQYVSPDAADVEAYSQVSGLTIPDESAEFELPDGSRGTFREAAGLGPAGRVAVHGSEDQHRPGGLAPKGAGVEPGYHEEVRVIPYKFRTAARNQREVIGGSRVVTDEPLTPDEAELFGVPSLAEKRQADIAKMNDRQRKRQDDVAKMNDRQKKGS